MNKYDANPNWTQCQWSVLGLVLRCSMEVRGSAMDGGVEVGDKRKM